MSPGKVQFITTVLVSFQLIFQVTSLQCGGGQSTLGMMLRRHVFKVIKGVSLGHECLQACSIDVRCQSFNYVISQYMCELNNRTKEARPEDFVPDPDRYYLTRDHNRGKWEFLKLKVKSQKLGIIHAIYAIYAINAPKIMR